MAVASPTARQRAVAATLKDFARPVRTIRRHDRRAARQRLYDCVAKTLVDRRAHRDARAHHPGKWIGGLAGKNDALGKAMAVRYASSAVRARPSPTIGETPPAMRRQQTQRTQ